MRTFVVFAVIVGITLAKESRDEIDKGKRDTSEDYHHHLDTASHDTGPSSRPVSFAEVIQRIPVRYSAVGPGPYHQPVIPQHHHFLHAGVGSAPFPARPFHKGSIPYPTLAFVKRVPYSPAIPLQSPSYQNLVITKVPLVYPATLAGGPADYLLQSHHQPDFSHFAPAPPLAVGRHYPSDHY